MKQNAEFTEVTENSSPILSSLWTKIYKILKRYRRPHTGSNSLVLLSMSHSVPKKFAILKVVEKPKKKKFLVPIFSRGTTPTFVRQIVSEIYLLSFGKV